MMHKLGFLHSHVDFPLKSQMYVWQISGKQQVYQKNKKLQYCWMLMHIQARMVTFSKHFFTFLPKLDPHPSLISVNSKSNQITSEVAITSFYKLTYQTYVPLLR